MGSPFTATYDRMRADVADDRGAVAVGVLSAAIDIANSHAGDEAVVGWLRYAAARMVSEYGPSKSLLADP